MRAWGDGGRLEGSRSLGPPAVQTQAPAERRDLRCGSGEVSRQVLPPERPRFRRGLRGGKMACGAATRVSDTHHASSKESRGTQLDPGPVLSNLSGRRESVWQLSCTSGPPGTSGRHTEPRAPGWEHGQAPLPISPVLTRKLGLPPTGVGPGAPRTQGAATAPFVGFGWKLHPEAPLPVLRELEVDLTLQEEAASFALGQKWCSSLEGAFSQNSRTRS